MDVGASIASHSMPSIAVTSMADPQLPLKCPRCGVPLMYVPTEADQTQLT